MFPTDTKIITTFSVQHTGTWFTINFLKKHPDVDNFAEINKIPCEKHNILYKKTNLLHSHIPHWITEPSKGFVDPNTLDFRQIFYHSLSHTFPTVIPIRDPLRCLITRQHYCPEKTHHYIIHGFVLLSEMPPAPTIKYLPIDLPMDIADRKALLDSVLDHCGLSSPRRFTQRQANSWPVSNKKTPANSQYKKAYLDGDINLLEKTFPGELAYLRHKEKSIRPFLEELGYENLLWWS